MSHGSKKFVVLTILHAVTVLATALVSSVRRLGSMTEDNNCEPKPDDVDYVVYAKQLFGCRLGYPIWFPKSGDWHDIQIGDVGYYYQGGFHRVFNTTLLDDDPSHINGLPYNYEPFQAELQRKEVGRITLVDRSVKYVQVQGGGGSDSTAVSPTRLGMSPTLDRSAAPAGSAFSSFAPPVDRLQIHPSKSFVAYMRANFQRWNAFLDSNDLDLDEVPLLFVSGTVKTSECGRGAFRSHFGVQGDQAWMASDQVSLKDQTLFINYFRMKDQGAHQKDGDMEGTVASVRLSW